MKYILLFFWSFIFSSALHAAKCITISGKIFSKEKFDVRIFEPINGYYNQASVNINSGSLKVTEDSFSYSFSPINNSPCFFSVELIQSKNSESIGRVNFLLCPGDSTFLQINPEENKYFNWIQFKGDNETGNNLFQKINYEPVKKFKDLFKLIENLPDQEDSFIQNVNGVINKITSQFEVLFREKKISASYFESMRTTFRMSLFGVAVSQFIYRSNTSSNTSKDFRDTVVETLFRQLDPLDNNIKSLYNSFIYIRAYYMFMACKQKKVEYKSLEKDTTIQIGGTNYLIDANLSFCVFIKDLKVREDLWAIQLFAFFQLAPGLFDQRIIDQFESIFPGSKYLPLIKKDFLQTSKIKKIEYMAQSPIVIVDSTLNNNTVDAILKEHRNKVVYVDLWASWCGPCIAAFAYNKIVDSFLLANNIDRVYISLDKNKSQWHNAVGNYQLGGYHVIANSYLLANIKKLIGLSEDSPIGIPHYLIYSKSGKLISNDAGDPINYEQLFEDFKNVLSQ